jgi:hypothetical protein
MFINSTLQRARPISEFALAKRADNMSLKRVSSIINHFSEEQIDNFNFTYNALKNGDFHKENRCKTCGDVIIIENSEGCYWQGEIITSRDFYRVCDRCGYCKQII